MIDYEQSVFVPEILRRSLLTFRLIAFMFSSRTLGKERDCSQSNGITNNAPPAAGNYRAAAFPIVPSHLYLAAPLPKKKSKKYTYTKKTTTWILSFLFFFTYDLTTL